MAGACRPGRAPGVRYALRSIAPVRGNGCRFRSRIPTCHWASIHPVVFTGDRSPGLVAARGFRARGGERLTPHRRAAGIATNSVRPCLSGPTTGAGEDQLSFGSSAPRRPVGLCFRLRGLTQPHRRAARAGPWWVACLGAGHMRRCGQPRLRFGTVGTLPSVIAAACMVTAAVKRPRHVARDTSLRTTPLARFAPPPATLSRPVMAAAVAAGCWHRGQYVPDGLLVRLTVGP